MTKSKGVRVLSAVMLGSAVLALGSGRAQAQDKGAEVDRIFGWAAAPGPGCVVAVAQKGEVVLNRAYGLADIEHGVPMSTESVLDIGSVRKQFIAAAILMLAEEGKLSLSDDVRTHVPELADYGHTVTLDHLLTHTSGVRDWTGLLPLTGGEADVWALIVRQRGLNFAPGEEWSYSNSGYVLLKEIVERVSGESFAEFAQERIFGPLGMSDTSYHEDLEGVIERRAMAYEKAGGGWEKDMPVGNRRGGGGALFSTAHDMVIWSEALAKERLGAFVSEKLMETAKLNNGRELRYARGLIVENEDGLKAVLHTGGAGGYSTFAGRFPDYGLSVAVLCNADAMGTSELANEVVKVFTPPETEEEAKRREAEASAEASAQGVDLSGRAGLFFEERSGEPLRLAERDGKLGIVGGPRLVPKGEDRFRAARANLFFRSQDEFEVRFLSDDRFELKSMEGQTTHFRRARPYEPTAADLEAFAGRYGSEDIGYDVEVVPAKGKLMFRLKSQPQNAFPLSPVEADVFQFRGMTLRFRRDAGGKVIGFDYSNPVVRGLEYVRLDNERADAP